MKKQKMMAMLLCLGLCAAPMTAVAEQTSEAAVETAAESAEDKLSAPVDFTFDPNTGEYSFTATDERTGYYFIRFYLTEDGKEVGEYVASSKRINGGKTGEFTGKIDLSALAWGTYHANLSSFAAAGTGIENADTVTRTVQYGVDQTLERPEVLAMTSGNQVELVVDWWTLCDYNFRQYMPNMQFTFYADEACTEEVMSDTVDLSPLRDTLSQNPPGLIYIWGWNKVEGPHFYTITSDGESGFGMGGNEQTFAFKNDIYTYTLDAGTYYVTAQALSKDEYTNDSEVSTVMEITLTDGEVTEEYETAKTEMWTDPQLMDMPGANPGQQPDRIDAPAGQGISGLIIE